MRALITLPEGSYVPIDSARLSYAPELADGSSEDIAQALVAARANVAIRTGEFDAATLGEWSAEAGGEPLVAVEVEPTGAATDSLAHPEDWSRAKGEREGVCRLAMPPSEDLLSRALGAAERALQREWLTAEFPAPAPLHRRESVLVVGLGIVNLITAHHLVRAGYEVTAVEAGPDPRDGCDWREYGCSRGGGDARMYSMTEADDYHDKALDAEPVNDYFRNPVSKGGWLMCEPDAAEREWVEEFERVPPWLARSYTADILALNRASGELWDSWLEEEADLFSEMTLTHDVLRLYSCRTQLKESIERQVMVGSLRGVYSPSAVKEEVPALAGAREEALAGGIMVRGFTLQVHRLMVRLLEALEAAGAEVRFLSPVSQLLRNNAGAVTGAVIDGAVLQRDHYALSPGIEASNVTPPPDLRNQVHGVLGGWITLPNLEPRLANSLKIARRYHLAEDANVTVAWEGDTEILYFGSGYGYTGYRHTPDEGELEMLRDAVLDSVETYFPAAWEAVGRDALAETWRYCIRPWTATNLGVFAAEPTPQGLAVWTGGHNTGGFAQAPVIAEAVLAALRGEYHEMHSAYRPARQVQALGALAGEAGGEVARDAASVSRSSARSAREPVT
jgi:glycine/D-amino acid oxidase-like deaminating enzyme